MKVKKSMFVASITILLFLVFYVMVLTLNLKHTKNISLLTIASFVINLLCCVIFLMKDSRPVSLNKVFLYFNLFFLCIAPLMQYISGINLWNYKLSSSVYNYTNILILIWILVFELFQTIFAKKYRKKRKLVTYEVKYKRKVLLLLEVLTVLCLGYMIKSVSFTGLFVRSDNYLNLDSAATIQIVMGLCRSVPVYTAIYAYYYTKMKKKNWMIVAFPLFATVLLNFPTSVARYWLAIVYIGLLLVVYEKKFRSRTFDFIIIIIFVIVFPVFQLFKWNGLEILSNINVVTDKLSAIYNNADFDAYSMFARTILYVKENGLDLGRQWLSIIFFIIPRSIWTSKPFPTGQLISSEQGQDFTNLSCPLIAEGYLAFGIVGIIILSALFSWISCYMDFAKMKNGYNEQSILNFIYPFLIGIYIYLQRGSVQPAVVYTFSFYVFIIGFYISSKLLQNISERTN